MSIHSPRSAPPQSGRVSIAPPQLQLHDPIRYARGVGPVRAAYFEKIGIRTVADLVEYVPFRYDLLPRSVPIGHLRLGETATIVGELRRVKVPTSAARQAIRATVVDGTGQCLVRWFHSPFLVGRIQPGQVVRLTGKVEEYDGRASLTNPATHIVADGMDPFDGDDDRYRPVYGATASLPSNAIARIVSQLLKEVADRIVEPLPPSLVRARNLPPRRTALVRLHQPMSASDLEIARRRLAYDELLLCQLAVQLSRRAQAQGPPAMPIVITEKIDQRIRARFPFKLTAGQDRAVAQIRADMARSRPMNRLLQGDVGSGKTAVAVYAALGAIAHRMQVALIAPTEVLASQHKAKLDEYLRGSRVRSTYLVGSTPRSDRHALLRSVARGETDLLIGTHALLERGVEFSNLGLVLIDEQHKFGVAQRAKLRQKGLAPHGLVITATPIPRTLAMTLFGDLDISTIRGLPPGRAPVQTRLYQGTEREDGWRLVCARLTDGEQAYVVFPLVEESEAIPLKAVTSEAEILARGILAGFRVGILHGRMKPGEQEQVLNAFRRGEIQVLVSTTVIEVGVDVPGATIMVVEHAERFGLGQLHQLRGRVGRGTRRSVCLLMTESPNESALERLAVLVRANDGFRIAEEDLRLRGPGELLGTRQHGMPALRFADLSRDVDLVTQARDDAEAILRSDPMLQSPTHALLRRFLADRHGGTERLRDVLKLIDVA